VSTTISRSACSPLTVCPAAASGWGSAGFDSWTAVAAAAGVGGFAALWDAAARAGGGGGEERLPAVHDYCGKDDGEKDPAFHG